jgi:cytoskeleton protein RodZ
MRERFNVENSELQGVTPGEMLRVAREALNISSREMADRLNWMPAYLIAVEENRFEALRGAAFARGYLRTYAKQVGIPESAVLAAFDALHAPELPAAEDRVEVKSALPMEKPGVGIALGLACAVLLIAGLWWWQSAAPQKPALAVTNITEQRPGEEALEQPIASDESLAAAAAQIAATGATLEEYALEEADAEVADAEVADAEVADAEVAEAELGEAEPEDVGAAPYPALDQSLISSAEDADTGTEGVESEAMLQFRFGGDCWVEIRDGNDELIYRDFRRDGDSLDLVGLPPFNILLGDSTEVELYYRGELVEITPRRGRVLARFTVGVP